MLAKLDPIERARLEDGDWDVHLSGGFFEVDKIVVVDAPLHNPRARVRAWDLAATPDAPGTDPDWTVGALLAEAQGQVQIEDLKRVRLGPGAVERLIAKTAAADGRGVRVLVEQEPGSAGKILRRHFATQVLRGYDFLGVPQSGSKYNRAKPLAAAMSNGLVSWHSGNDNRQDAFAELRAFSDDPKRYSHDDIVDALSLGHWELTRPKRRSPVRGLT